MARMRGAKFPAGMVAPVGFWNDGVTTRVLAPASNARREGIEIDAVFADA